MIVIDYSKPQSLGLTIFVWTAGSVPAQAAQVIAELLALDVDEVQRRGLDRSAFVRGGVDVSAWTKKGTDY